MAHRIARTITIVSVLAAPPLLAQGFEEEVRSISVIGSLTTVSVGDMDGDGDLDVVSAGASSIVWSENLGDGIFRQSLALSGVAPNDVIRKLALSDLDGDGDLDLAFTRFPSPSVAWIENLGGGSFGDSQVVGTGFTTDNDLLAADVNQDGLPDLVVYQSVTGAAWYRNLGGAFGPRLPLDSAAGSITGLAADDMDGDGDMDIVVSKASGDRIQWLEQTAPGVFDTIRTLSQSVTRPQNVQVNDIDADGAPDLVAHSTDTGALLWMRNLGGATFGPAQVIQPFIQQNNSVLLEDLDGDGLTDAFWFNTSDNLVTRRNNGAGFDAQVITVLPLNSPRDAAVLDRDGDGDRDLVVVQFRYGQFVDQTPNGFEAAERSTVDIPYDPNARLARSADLDGDGLADLVASENQAADPFLWFKNRGDGIWTSIERRFAGRIALGVDLIDIDGDGDMDLLLVDRNGTINDISLALNQGDGSIADSVVLEAGAANIETVLNFGDAEADGDLDILWTRGNPSSGFAATSHGWLLQTSPGVFAPSVALPNDLLTYKNLLADVDGDGDSDAVFLYPFALQPSWRVNDGTGSFGPITPLGNAVGQVLLGIAAEDMDGDGIMDIVASGVTRVHWFRSLGGGAFAPGAPVDSSGGAEAVVLEDVNRDGLPDVLVSGEGQPARLIRNLGGGAFDVAELLPELELGSWVMDVADYDGDLDLDILKRGEFGGYAWNTNAERFGSGYCGPAETNSNGDWAAMSAAGSASVLDNDVTLIAERLPVGSFGYFLIAPADNFVPAAGGSSGNLCLGGAIGRLNRGAAEIFQASASGDAAVSLDLTNVPTPTGAVSLTPGDTRYVQAWFRDANPGVTSNFTNGLRLSFE